MRLSRLENLSADRPVYFIYSTSASFEYYVKSELKERFKVRSEYIVYADKAKELKSAKLDSYAAPVLSNKWLIHVNADSVSQKDIETSVNNPSTNAIFVYWYSKYSAYKKVENSSHVKDILRFCNFISLSSLTKSDIFKLYLDAKSRIDSILLSEDMIRFVIKSYRRSPQAVFDLIKLMESGVKFNTKSEIIDAIGYGSMSIDSIVLQLLKEGSRDKYTAVSEYKATAKRVSNRRKALLKSEEEGLDRDIIESLLPEYEKRKYNKALKSKKIRKLFKYTTLFNYIAMKYEYVTIYNSILNVIDGFIELKQLQITGIGLKNSDDELYGFNNARLLRLKRYKDEIANNVSMKRLVTIRTLVSKYRSYSAEVAIVQFLSDYVDSVVS